MGDNERGTEAAVTAFRAALQKNPDSVTASEVDQIVLEGDSEIEAVATRFCLPPEDRAELRRRVHERVRTGVIGAEPVWEQRFRAAVRRTAMREARHMDRTPEKTVALLRAAFRAQQGTPVTMLTHQLLDLAENGIHAVANRFNFALEPRTELRQRVHAKVWDKVRGDDTFWERRFGLALKRLALNEARSIIREPTHEHLDDEHPQIQGTLETAVQLHLQSFDVGRCLEALPALLQQAVELRYVEGLPVESSRETADTVAARMGVTGRSVRNYLRQAEALLRECLSQ